MLDVIGRFREFVRDRDRVGPLEVVVVGKRGTWTWIVVDGLGIGLGVEEDGIEDRDDSGRERDARIS